MATSNQHIAEDIATDTDIKNAIAKVNDEILNGRRLGKDIIIIKVSSSSPRSSKFYRKYPEYFEARVWKELRRLFRKKRDVVTHSGRVVKIDSVILGHDGKYVSTDEKFILKDDCESLAKRQSTNIANSVQSHIDSLAYTESIFGAGVIRDYIGKVHRISI